MWILKKTVAEGGVSKRLYKFHQRERVAKFTQAVTGRLNKDHKKAVFIPPHLGK